MCGSTAAVRQAAEREAAEVRMQALAIQCRMHDRAMAEVERRQQVLVSRVAALDSVYEDIAAGRMR
jgi:hypothetical protein